MARSQLKIDNAMSTLDGTRRMRFRDLGSCSGGGVGRVVISHELKEVSLTWIFIVVWLAFPNGSTGVV